MSPAIQYMRVDLSGAQIAVAQLILYSPNIGTILKQMRGKTISKLCRKEYS